MSKFAHRLASAFALAAVLFTIGSARAAYSDEYVSVSSDEVTVIDLGSDICYVFSNAVDGVALTTKKQMMLRSYLVVGGGGAGGGQLGGGGGGGGVTNGVDVNLSIAADTAFTITVGAGAPQPASASVRGENGAHSSLIWTGATLWGYGGGGGGYYFNNKSPNPAAVENEIGSGGGGADGETGGTKGIHYYQGNPGGKGGGTLLGGGGGGASEAGNTKGAGRGGEGIICNITGDPQVYGSGGGAGPQGGTRYAGGTNAGTGGCGNPALAGEPGVDGFGGGGGGGAYNSNTRGGAGGSGTVIVRFAKRDIVAYFFEIEPIDDQWWLGEEIFPAVSVVHLSDGSAVDPANYELVYENNDGVGTASVTAIGKGDYAGVVFSQTFEIKECYADDNIFSADPTVQMIEQEDYFVYVFTNVAIGAAQVQMKKDLVLKDALVVGGGGGGAGFIGGGGGGGGVNFAEDLNLVLSAENAFSVKVGAGAPQNLTIAAQGYNGEHSCFVYDTTTLWGYGGGGGGSWSGAGNQTPRPAEVENQIGSGGGGASGSTGGTKGTHYYQGNPGGPGGGVFKGGGGGGAGEAGNTKDDGIGGEGVTNWITGVGQVYGSGGGAGPQGETRYAGGTNAGMGGRSSGPELEGEPGVDGFGGGGGGGAYAYDTRGGAGGSGTVILKFAKKDYRQYLFTASLAETEFNFTGYEICPEPTVVHQLGGAPLVKGEEYTVRYENNLASGTARVIVEGAVGTGYEPYSQVLEFTILNTFEDENVIIDNTKFRVRQEGDRYYYIFTNCEEATVLNFKRTMTLVEGLLVGGGGAGGAVIAGGGGGGGVITSVAERVVFAGGQMTVRVGAGGTPTGSWNAQGNKGGDSSYTHNGFTLTAYGGAGGCGFSQGGVLETMGPYGSGGGGGASAAAYVDGIHYTASQGNRGGYGGAGGGGGAAEPGYPSAGSVAGNGGEGITNSITGVAEVYGSGGGGGTGNGVTTNGRGGTHAGDGAVFGSSAAAGSGDPGFGGGGGSSGYSPQTAIGSGGSGIVVLGFVEGGEVPQPTIAGVTTEFVGDTTQPKALVTLGCEKQGAVFSATVKVQFGSANGEWLCEGTVQDVGNGETAEIRAPFSPETGSTIWMRVTVTCEGTEDIVNTVSKPAEGTQSPYVGKGGGTNVIHVRAGATGRGDGSDWFNAMTDFREALKQFDETRTELWLAGDETMNFTVSAINPAVPAIVRGGFTGLECAAADRAADAYSTIDGNSKYTCLTLQNASALTIERFRIWGRSNNAIAKTGAGNLAVTNCIFENCSAVCASISGTAASTEVSFADSSFTDLTAATSGSALLASSLKRLYLDNCQFVRCGVSLAAPIDSNYGYNSYGHALCFSNVPVTMRGCVIKGCRATSIGNAGGVVYLGGACGGSAMTNCAFAVNEATHSFDFANWVGDNYSGILSLNLDSRAAALDLVNCTFAANLADTTNAPAGLHILKGTANVKNTIFTGAKVGRPTNIVSRDIWADANGVANISYSIFDEEGAECIGGAEGSAITFGKGVIYGDPLLVSLTNDVLESFITTRASDGRFAFNGSKAAALCDWVNVHVRGRGGYDDEKTGERIRFKGVDLSPAINTGDPKSDCRLEPKPNGKRINLGYYGGTPWATCSPPGMAVRVR